MFLERYKPRATPGRYYDDREALDGGFLELIVSHKLLALVVMIAILVAVYFGAAAFRGDQTEDEVIQPRGPKKCHHHHRTRRAKSPARRYDWDDD